MFLGMKCILSLGQVEIDGVFCLRPRHRARLELVIEPESTKEAECHLQCQSSNTLAEEGAYPEAHFCMIIGTQ